MYSVLVVDDSQALARQLENILAEMDGFEVEGVASNGAQAIKMYKTLNPDVVLMDIVMPMMDGLQSLRTILKLDPSAKVVMISSLGGVGSKVEEALRLGAQNVISKPFDKEQIYSVLKRIFEPDSQQ